MLHVSPTLCKLRCVQYAFHTPTPPTYRSVFYAQNFFYTYYYDTATNTDHVNKSPPNHSLNPFRNNYPPKQNHTPIQLLTHSLPPLQCRCYYMHVTACMLLHLCYCMFVTTYIITCYNVKELCLSQRSVCVCFVLQSRQQLFICTALTTCSL
jgi:hypothetical protein